MPVNRGERRRAAKLLGGNVCEFSHGRVVVEADPFSDEAPVKCHLCGAEHKMSAVIQVEDKRSSNIYPLCERCFALPDADDLLTRKLLNAPGLAIEEGGETTDAAMVSMTEKQNQREH